jgi:hypothetical protein
MGIAVGDTDGDGLDDLFVSNFSEDHCTLYRAEGGGLFEDVSAAVGISGPTHLPLSWARRWPTSMPMATSTSSS